MNLHNNIIPLKSELMGLAIIFVLLCHLSAIPIPFLKLFAPGLVGCDIFIILSGCSLGYSYKKHSISVFYKRRFFRIYPLFVIMAIMQCVLIIIFVRPINILDWLCSVTLLSYYTNLSVGSVIVDWYLSVSFLLYFLYPILFRIPRNILIITAVILITTLQVLYSYEIIDLKTAVACGMARFPMFCWGIWLFKEITANERNREFKKFVFIYLSWLIPLMLTIAFKCHFFYICEYAAPYLLLLLVAFSLYINKKSNMIRRFLFFLGNHTLEIYIANLVSYTLCQYLTQDIFIRSTTLLGGTVILSILLCYINNNIRKIVVGEH